MTTAISPPIPTFCASASAGRCRKSTPCLSKRLTDRWTRCPPSRNSLFAETDCDRRPDAARAKLAQTGGHPADPVADRRLRRDPRQPVALAGALAAPGSGDLLPLRGSLLDHAPEAPPPV